MKLYEKIIDGKKQVKPRNKIVITKNGLSTYNPTEEMLFADGWVEHIPEIHIPTEEEILNDAKNNIIDIIIDFDSSEEVNSFYINDQEMWLDKATRVGLKLRFDAELASGKKETVLWYDGMQFPLQLEMAIQMLNAIELYASACYDMTQQHIASIKMMTTVDDVNSYDYRSGYPEKLRF